MDYSGKIITKNAVTPTQTAASGVWTLDDALQAQKGNNWPIPGVPNPISKSLRFNSADSAYLNRTPTIQGNRRTWTWSGWVKRSALGTTQQFFTVETVNGGTYTDVKFGTDNKLYLDSYGTTGALQARCLTDGVFRDVGAWYHIVAVLNTPSSTAADRAILYVNGTRVSQSITDGFDQNAELMINTTNEHRIGADVLGNEGYLSGYLTEINFVDGQALTPSDFGMTDTNTGVWIPKKYTGTYGTNGFYVNFKDATNTTTIGYDYSGNGNNWNANNFSVTAGAGNDSMTDVPTPWVGYSVNGDTGGVVRGNYCTWNPLNKGSNYTLANGNLDSSSSTAAYAIALATFGMTTGKWYWEVTVTNKAAGADIALGICKEGITLTQYLGQSASAWAYATDGKKYNNNTAGTYGSTYTTNDVIGIAFDADIGSLFFYKNGTVQNSGTAAYTGLTSGPYFPAADTYNAMTHVVNFGQRPFAYTPPAGFLSLCTTNLPTPTIGATSSTRADDYFNTVLYTGTGSSLGVTGVGFQPDFVWIKSRSAATDHGLYDAVRGVQKQLESNNTGAETTETTGLTAFNTDGFTVGALAQLNTNTATYVGWNWKANGAGSSNTAGSITSTVSANTTAGFSIVTYTGVAGNVGKTIGHGLGVAPKMIIIKIRDAAVTSTNSWVVYTQMTGAGQFLLLNSTNAATADVGNYFNNTSPTSTVFSVGGDSSNVNNENGKNYVAYCFSEVAGYSAFGSYTGNGNADGPFIYTGFRPAFLMTKRTNTTGDWYIWDATRSPSNAVALNIWPNYSSAEYNYGADGTQPWDFLSNGMKPRVDSIINNTSGSTYIYMAFAQNPFKFANAR